MKLYDRDYTVLTVEENEDWSNLDVKATLDVDGLPLMPKGVRRNNYRDLPKAVRHYKSLFPNNYLDICDLKQEDVLHSMIDKFEQLLDDGTTGEREILNYIRDKKAYHIIASILSSGYNFGHHSAYLFSEFQLGNSFVADYLIVGESSGGHEFIFIELENNKGTITRQDGEFGQVINKGLKQISDWKAWLEQNYMHLKETFDKVVHPRERLADEFSRYDSTRVHYVCVAGRRDNYKDNTYRNRRRMMLEQHIQVIHYDNLIDFARNTIGDSTY
ncbi:Shedu anti-phage system protein SduA domain-containing protein [Clostridium tagluense]|uniref:Shedu anti-phage system protein SduA domain-containing protein n=1 Tax=Clostridium tagluense TaxID=360422 RepID=UPI001C6DE3CF|nr:Shedu anti-phage system protein SduA domain-containing protein [Clostridium tagluense]MBW9158643.1 DUF4263 domain-containing protein [Clostridium tagluense]WLC68548.1 DUF4263 domain-containing protein [Clostridium tagluense]